MTTAHRKVALATIALSIVSMLLPWYTASAGLFSVSISGMDLEGATFSLILLLAYAAWFGYHIANPDGEDVANGWSVWWAGSSVIWLIALFIDRSQQQDAVREAGELGVVISTSAGYWLAFIAGLIFAGCSFHALVEYLSDRNSPSTSYAPYIPASPATRSSTSSSFASTPGSSQGGRPAVSPPSARSAITPSQPVADTSANSLPRLAHGVAAQSVNRGGSNPVASGAPNSPRLAEPVPKGMIVLTHPKTGARALIDPTNGFNLYSFRVPHDNEDIDVIWSEPGFGGHDAKPTRSGIPILFPFAGRISNSAYSWRTDRGTKSIDITTAGKNGDNAIHGFVVNRPWRVRENFRHRATAVFQGSIDAPETLADWPSDYLIRVTWVVGPSGLTAHIYIQNPGESDLPFTFGLHPYFRIPFGGGSRDNIIATVPAESVLELEDLLPTGQVLPVDAPRDLRRGRRFSDITVDDVYTNLVPNDRGQITTTLRDDDTGITIVQRFSNEYPFVVVFTPPHREAIAIEPYTGAPDPFKLFDTSLDPRIAVLKPRQTWETTYSISVEFS